MLLAISLTISRELGNVQGSLPTSLDNLNKTQTQNDIYKLLFILFPYNWCYQAIFNHLLLNCGMRVSMTLFFLQQQSCI